MTSPFPRPKTNRKSNLETKEKSDDVDLIKLSRENRFKERSLEFGVTSNLINAINQKSIFSSQFRNKKNYQI